MRTFIILLLCFQCFAQLSYISDLDDQYTGTAALPFLKLPVGAKSAAMGGNAASLLDDPSAVFMNPAVMGGFSDNGILLSHEQMYFGLRHEYAGWCMPTYNYGVFGAQWNMLSSGAIEGARDIDERPVSPAASDMSLGAAYAKALWRNRVFMGLNLQFLQSTLGNVTARGFAGDAGLFLKLPYSLRTSIAVKNLGSGITYVKTNEPLPAGILWDAAYTFLNDRAGVSAGLKKFSDSPLKVSAGGEFFIHPSLCARLGYEYAMTDDEQTESIKGLCAGIGIRYGLFTADYAYARHGEFLQGGHVFSAGLRFGRILPLTDMDFFKRAQQYFRQERYEKCIETAKEALKLNPNLWQAHLLIEEALRMMRVKEKTLIALFYTADARGTFVPSSAQGVGGLARRSGVLKTLYQDYPLSITLDAGNFLDKGNDKSKRELGYRLLKYMNYAAVNTGTGEYAIGVDTIFAAAEKAGLPCLSANLEAREYRGKIIDRRLFSIGGRYNVTVIGVLKPVKKAGKEAVITEMAPALSPLVAEVRSKSDLVVVLSSDALEECRALAASVKGIDVIICGDGSGATYTPVSEGRTLIVSPGAGGENLGFLSLQFSANKKLVSFANRIIPLDVSVPEDGYVARLLKHMLARSDSELPEPKLLPSPYILPFVSNYDITAYHYKGLETSVVDSLALASLDSTVDVATVNLDSVKELVRRKDSLSARDTALKHGFSGLYDPADTLDQIYLQFVLTGKTRRITWNERQNHDPVLNFQGSAVLYCADTVLGKVAYDGTDNRTSQTDFFVYDLPYDYTIKVAPEEGKSIVSAVWSSDGQALYTVERDKSGRRDVFLKAVGKKVKFNVSRSDKASAYEVAVSPDSRNIAYTSDREEGTQLYLSDPMGNHPLRITFGTGYCSKIAFSATGRYLAYAYSNSRKDNPTDLYVLDIRTNTLDTLSINQPVYDITWNGDKELYITQGINFTDINVVDLKTKTPRRLTQRSRDAMESERYPVLFDTGEDVLVYFESKGKEALQVVYTQGGHGEVKPAFQGNANVRLK